MRIVTPKEFGRFGRNIWYREKNGTIQHNFVGEVERSESLSTSEKEKFHSFFGTSPLVCSITWKKLIEYDFMPRKGSPFHMLWALMFLKLYSNENTLSSIADTSNRTFRKWSWKFVIAFRKLQPFVVSLLIKTKKEFYSISLIFIFKFCICHYLNRFGGRTVSVLTMAAFAKFLWMELIF